MVKQTQIFCDGIEYNCVPAIPREVTLLELDLHLDYEPQTFLAKLDGEKFVVTHDTKDGVDPTPDTRVYWKVVGKARGSWFWKLIGL